MGRARTPEEVQRAFEIQRKSIQSSCAAYDAGERWEAYRIATAIHTLVHDSGKSYRSILTQLGIRGSLRFFSSGRETEEHAMWSPLVSSILSPIPERNDYLPMFDMAPQQHPRWMHKLIQFHAWWEGEHVFIGPSYTFSRKGLVFALRNKEGGAHFGELDDPRYNEMLRDPRLTGAPPGVELAIMRQVGWELMRTFETNGHG